MGIFSRFADVVKANVNDLLDKAEDPEKIIKQMVLEMEESVNKVTLAVAQSIANEKSLQRKVDKARESESKWHDKAKQALEAGRDDLAKQALEKRATFTKQADDLTPALESAKSITEKLRSQLSELKAKLEEARTRKSTLIARSQSAKAQKQISQSFSGVGLDAFSKFDKFESKVESMEAEADAYGELAGEDSSLEAEFKALETSSLDDELAKLKQEMGK